jgi:hypothetical protein
MSLTFANPAMLWGLTSLLALTGIYMLRMRSHRHIVSSLLLWGDDGKTSDQGRTFRRLRASMLFLLAFLALLLLAMAAADPLRPREGRKPILIVLDNSFSMAADGDNSPRRQALDSLNDLLGNERKNARFILAGSRPALLPDQYSSTDDLEEQWTCQAPTADLNSAIALARRVASDQRIIVLTDAAPPDDNPNLLKNLRWKAFGTPQDNQAVVGAVRSDSSTGGKAIVEIANFAEDDASIEMIARQGETSTATTETFAPREIRRFTIPLAADAGPLDILLKNDALSFDNQATLLRNAPYICPVEVSLQDEAIQEALRRALEATDRASITSDEPLLRFSDANPSPRNGCWDVVLETSETAEPLLGPFVLDKSHTLLEGVMLTGVVMSRDLEATMPGEPLISSDDGTLMSQRVMPSGRRLHMQLTSDKSTLLESVDFPILIANILRWREEGLPERTRPNVRLDDNVRILVSDGRQACVLETPDGEEIHLTPARDDAVTFSCDQPGRYALRLDPDTPQSRTLNVSANVLFRDESNLLSSASGTWGKFERPTTAGTEYGTLAPLLFLAALAAWLIHGMIVKRRGGAEA